MGLATRCAVIVTLALLATTAVWGDSYDYTWSGPTSGGSWQGNNWNQGLQTGPLGGYTGIPTATVYIGPGNVVTIGGSPNNSWAAAGTLTIASGSQLVVPGESGPPYFQAASSLINGGDILLGNLNGAATLQTGASIGYGSYQGATLDGGGTITLTNGSQLTLPNYGIGTNQVELINQTVRGDGLIAETNLVIDTPSRIDANHNGQRLLMDSQAGNSVVTNNGIMQASNGGTLQLGSSHWAGGPVTITQGAGGLIQALDGSTVMLGYSNVDYDPPGSITGGTLSTSGIGAHIDVRDDFLLNGVTTAADMRVYYNSGENANGLQLANTINNTGTITLVSAGIDIASVGATLTGAGTVNMGGNGINGSGATLTNVGNLIQGAGSISAIVLNNQSLIDSNTSGQTLSIVGSTINNAGGTLQAANGGTLQIGGGHWSGGGTNVNGGTIQALDGSKVLLGYTNPGDYDSAGTITGSTLKTAGSGVIQASDYIVLNGIANQGNLNVVAVPGVGGSVVQLSNTINNTGTITMAGGTIQISGAAGLTGGGTVNMGGGSISQGTLTNVDNHIQGAGGFSGMTANNQGLIDSNTSGQTLSIVGSTVNNAGGTLQAANGGTLQIGGGHWSGGGTNVNGGTIQALDGSTVLLGYTNPGDYDSAGTITGSTLKTAGSGVIQASDYVVLDGITNNASLQVVAVPGIQGNVAVLRNTINNTGSINLAGGNIQIDGAAALTGSGTVNLNGGSISWGALTNVNNTIQGTGSLWNLGTLNNAGLIDSNQSGGTISVGAAAITNSGTMRATNGGTLLFSGGSYTGAGGTVQAGAGSAVTFQSATIGGTTTFSGPVTAYNSTLQNLNMSGNLVGRQATTIGGTLTNAGQLDLYDGVTLVYSTSAPLTFNGPGTTWFHGGLNVGGDSEDPAVPAVTNNSTLRGSFSMSLGWGKFVNNGTLYAANGDTIYVAGGYGGWGTSYSTNNGTYRVDAGGTMAIGQLSNHDGSTQTLTGGTYSVAGTLKLADNWAPATIVNNAANIIMDGPSASMLAWFKYNGATSDALAGFNNNMAAGSFTLMNGANFTAGGSFSNAGAVDIGTGSTFQVGPTGSLGTYTQTAGSTKLNGTLTAATVNIAGGTLSGAGTLNAGLIVSGTLSPGNSPGTIVVNGDYTQTGTLNIEVAMDVADQVQVNGNVSLGGILDVITYGTWSGAVDKDFLILSWTGSKSGNFDQILLPTLAGYQFNTDWGANGLYLDVTGNGPSSGTPEPTTATFILIGAALLLGGYKLRRNR